MGNFKKWNAFVLLLTTKGYRKVIIIPLVFFLGFFVYSLYTDFVGGTAEKMVYDDGTMRIYAQSELGSCKLPEILDGLNIPIHNELKISFVKLSWTLIHIFYKYFHRRFIIQ